MDGHNQPNCKRASRSQILKKELDWINAFTARQSALLLSVNVEQDSGAIDELSPLASKLKESSKSTKILDLFKDNLTQRLNKLGSFSNNKYNDRLVNSDIIQAEFQADSYLAKHHQMGRSDFIFSSDTDFLAR